MIIDKLNKNSLSLYMGVIGVILLLVQGAIFVCALNFIKLSNFAAPSTVSSANLFVSGVVPVPMVKPKIRSEINIVSNKNNSNDSSFKNSKYLKIVSLFPSMELIFGNKIDYTRNGNDPLSSSQAKLYKDIFELQRYGKWEQADRIIAKIKDTRLIGYVLYQRYMYPSYQSDFAELKNWLDRFSDYPNADKIYKLAKSKQGYDSFLLKNPSRTRILAQIKEPNIYYPKRYIPQIKRSNNQYREVQDFSRNINFLVRKGRAQEALVHLASFEVSKDIMPYMDKVEIDHLKANIAAGLLYRGLFNQAQSLAKESLDRSGIYVPEAAWIVGLSLWLKRDFAAAAPYFEKAGDSPYASAWRSSAGYYWAARSYSRTGNHKKVRENLEKASSHLRTFYGLVATKMLNKPFAFNWDKPKFIQKYKDIIKTNPAGMRAMLLVAAGQYDLAEAELLRLDYRRNSNLRRAALSYAMHVGLSGVALRLGNMVRASNKQYYDLALYPDVPWKPSSGFILDPALVYAVMRQESRFDQQAKSYSGAQGLMQIMPKTAYYIAKKQGYTHKVNKISLGSPEINMMVGQDYLNYLLKGQYVRGDMISLLVAYNAGPGNLLKWKKHFENIAGNSIKNVGFSDPLLFIETIPIQETRDYVVRVLSNYWIYRLRAGKKLTSLAHLLKGQSPRYALMYSQEDTSLYVAKK